MSDRIPPHNLASERRMLGTVLLWPDSITALDEVRVDDFWLPAHREVIAAMRDLAARGVRIDPIVLGDHMVTEKTLPKLEGGVAYLNQLANEARVPEVIGHDVKLVRGKATLRRLIALCAQTQSRCFAEPDVDALMVSFRDDASKLEIAGTDDQDMVRVEDELPRVYARLQERAQNPDRHVVRTGLREFDRRMGGGLQLARLIVVASPPGFGKTSWLGTLVSNAALRYEVPSAIFSMEMDRDELIGRFVMGELRRNTLDFTTGEIARSDEGASEFIYGAQKFNRKPLYVHDRASMTIGKILARARRWYAKVLGAKPGPGEPPKPAVIGIDYLQLVLPDEDDDSDTLAEEIGKITRACKLFAMDYKIAVVLLSQLNRQWAKRGSRPQLSDLRASGSIEQDADMVLFPWVEATKGTDGKDVIASGPADIIVEKCRWAPACTVPAFFKREYQRFEDVDEYRSEP